MSRRLSRKEKAAIERAGLLYRLATDNFYAMPLERLRRVVAAIDQPAPTLTEAERGALDNAAQWLVAIQSADDPRAGECAATLRSLLARLGGDS